MSSALLVIDMQPDFMPGGPLQVAEGDALIRPIGALMECGRFDVCVATQDWHPPGHVSFASSHPGRNSFEVISLHGHEQTLWPDHCVQGTPGAELHHGLPWTRVAAIIRKGSDLDTDSYSGLRNNWNARGERPPTGLTGYLRDRGINELFVCGLARDFCVKWSAEDAADAGFRVHVLWSLTRPVHQADDERVRTDLEQHGIDLESSDGSPSSSGG